MFHFTNKGPSPLDISQPCPFCDGTGTVACEFCGGTGLDEDGNICQDCVQGLTDCEVCGGVGSVDTRPGTSLEDII